MKQTFKSPSIIIVVIINYYYHLHEVIGLYHAAFQLNFLVLYNYDSPACHLNAEWCQGLDAGYVWLSKRHLVVPLLRWQLLQYHSLRKFSNYAPPCSLVSESFFTDPTRSIIDQQPAINVLEEIQAFLEANPSEVITIFIEDYVTSPKGLTKVFTNSGLMKYWFPVSRMPQNGRNWPLLGDMIDKNQRLVVFTSKSWKEASEGIAYEWRYVVENQCN